MTNITNDDRILELKKQIQAKKDKIGKATKTQFVTNLVIDLDGVKINLNVLTKEALVSLAIKINAYLMSAKDLGLADQYVVSGYKAEDWLTDIKAKINILSRREEERQLAEMEEKLSKLLSEGKRVELEIDAIASLLK